MRILFTSPPAVSALHVLIPVAREAAARGHDVVFACSRSMSPTVEVAGLRHYSAGHDYDGSRYYFKWLVEEGYYDSDTEPGPWMIADQCARVAADDLMRMDWKPDRVVRSVFELGGHLYAQKHGIPEATVWFSDPTLSPSKLAEVWGEHLNANRKHFDLDPDPGIKKLFNGPQFGFLPAAWWNGTEMETLLHHSYNPRFDKRSQEDDILPEWMNELPKNQPIVLCTFGTCSLSREQAIEKAIHDLQDEEIFLIIARGSLENNETVRLRNGVLVDHVQYSQVIPKCEAVVLHGGYGTIASCVQYGVPMVVMPLDTYDNITNGERVLAMGAGLMADLKTDWSLRDAVRRAGECKKGSIQLQEAYVSQPGLDEVVKTIEEQTA